LFFHSSVMANDDHDAEQASLPTTATSIATSAKMIIDSTAHDVSTITSTSSAAPVKTGRFSGLLSRLKQQPKPQQQQPQQLQASTPTVSSSSTIDTLDEVVKVNADEFNAGVIAAGIGGGLADQTCTIDISTTSTHELKQTSKDNDILDQIRATDAAQSSISSSLSLSKSESTKPNDQKPSVVGCRDTSNVNLTTAQWNETPSKPQVPISGTTLSDLHREPFLPIDQAPAAVLIAESQSPCTSSSNSLATATSQMECDLNPTESQFVSSVPKLSSKFEDNRKGEEETLVEGGVVATSQCAEVDMEDGELEEGELQIDDIASREIGDGADQHEYHNDQSASSKKRKVEGETEADDDVLMVAGQQPAKKKSKRGGKKHKLGHHEQDDELPTQHQQPQQNTSQKQQQRAQKSDKKNFVYVCKICSVPGHHITNCPNFVKCPDPSMQPPPGYVCKKCKTPGHFIQNCPEWPENMKNQKQPQQQQQQHNYQQSQPNQQQQHQAAKPPTNYLCHRCRIPGHYIQDCPELLLSHQGPHQQHHVQNQQVRHQNLQELQVTYATFKQQEQRNPSLHQQKSPHVRQTLQQSLLSNTALSGASPDIIQELLKADDPSVKETTLFKVFGTSLPKVLQEIQELASSKVSTLPGLVQTVFPPKPEYQNHQQKFHPQQQQSTMPHKQDDQHALRHNNNVHQIKRNQQQTKQQQQQEVMKATLCRHYPIGRCWKGDTCPYSHDLSQLPDGEGNNRQPIPQKSAPVCRFFRAGQCKQSDCSFSHDLSKEPCAFFHILKSGCTKGDTCPFSHGAVSEERRQAMIEEHKAFKEKRKALDEKFTALREKRDNIQNKAELGSLTGDSTATAALSPKSGGDIGKGSSWSALLSNLYKTDEDLLADTPDWLLQMEDPLLTNPSAAVTYIQPPPSYNPYSNHSPSAPSSSSISSSSSSLLPHMPPTAPRPMSTSGSKNEELASLLAMLPGFSSTVPRHSNYETSITLSSPAVSSATSPWASMNQNQQQKENGGMLECLSKKKPESGMGDTVSHNVIDIGEGLGGGKFDFGSFLHQYQTSEK
jgi:hypothetical protein